MTEEKLEKANHIISRMKYLKDTFIEPCQRNKDSLKNMIAEDVGTHLMVEFFVSGRSETASIPMTILLDEIEVELKGHQEELDKLKKEFKEL
tara:strand:+ start:210 stop:485 length:276 start_codon:yes stop_codon:yes gene_type:complete